MTKPVFLRLEHPTVPIVGVDDVFPVGRIFCVGRNYAAHAREMGKDPDREAPFFFTKFPGAIAACIHASSGATGQQQKPSYGRRPNSHRLSTMPL